MDDRCTLDWRGWPSGPSAMMNYLAGDPALWDTQLITWRTPGGAQLPLQLTAEVRHVSADTPAGTSPEVSSPQCTIRVEGLEGCLWQGAATRLPEALPTEAVAALQQLMADHPGASARATGGDGAWSYEDACGLVKCLPARLWGLYARRLARELLCEWLSQPPAVRAWLSPQRADVTTTPAQERAARAAEAAGSYYVAHDLAEGGAHGLVGLRRAYLRYAVRMVQVAARAEVMAPTAHINDAFEMAQALQDATYDVAWIAARVLDAMRRRHDPRTPVPATYREHDAAMDRCAASQCFAAAPLLDLADLAQEYGLATIRLASAVEDPALLYEIWALLELPDLDIIADWVRHPSAHRG